MIYIKGWANFNLKRWDVALHNFLKHRKKDDNATLYELIGICHYKKKDYLKAASSFKQSYELYNKLILKHTSAYNVAANYAKLNKTEKAIKWLKIP